jgi:hypothetical protein
MSSRRGTSDLTILVVAGSLMVGLSVAAFLISPGDAAVRVPGSSYSARPDGMKAAFLVLKDLGHAVERSFDPLAELRANPGATALVIANPSQSPSLQDQRALQSFVRSGGSVIAFGRRAAAFLPGVGQVAEGEPGRVRDFGASLPSALTRGAPKLSARAVVPPKLDAAYVPVYGSLESPGVVTARIGAGQIIWCLDHGAVSNDGIARANNVRLLANAAGAPGRRTIVWDEHYHGERRSFWSYVAATPLPWGLGQLAVVALAGLAAVSRRRGPLRSRSAEPRTSPLEFIDTMASLYERAGVGRAAVESARLTLRRRLAAASGLPVAAGDERLASAAAVRPGIDPARTKAALSAAADALRRGTTREQDVVAIVAELQDLSAGAAAARAGHAVREHR